MRHALVDKNNKVVNVIIWDGRPLTPPKDHMIVQSDTVCMGDEYDPVENRFFKQKSED